MSEDYRSMWQNLGLDLVAHDALLGVLGKFYQDIYLAQKNRPEGMGYFDFVMSEVHGLRIKELLDEKKAGRKIIGCYCVFVPEEIVLAGNATIVGLCAGADFATEEVEKMLPRNTCALIKSTFGFKLGKVCPYLEASDMIVGENTCDGKKKAYESLGSAGFQPLCDGHPANEVGPRPGSAQSRIPAFQGGRGKADRRRHRRHTPQAGH